jgi:N-acyl-D-amino-acid deacylase
VVELDWLIRGGTLVDGSGAPGVRGDLGIADGRIVEQGRVTQRARRVLDAEGKVVAPGFVDVHTHYDAQVLWDRMLTISPWHGVTSVVIGNCGFGIAPTRREHRKLILQTLENVEGMSLDALQAGIGPEWSFESFPQFLDAIEAGGIAINVGAMLGHTPLRLYVMGPEATEREATPAEVASMRELLRDALAAGALGFATSKSGTHVGFEGRPVPSRPAHMSELEQLADCLREAGHGVFQATIGKGLFMEELAALQRRSGATVSWTALLGGMLGPDGHRRVLEQSRALQAEGVRVVPQVSCRPLMVEYDLAKPFPLESMSLFKPVSAADREGRKSIYADLEFRNAWKERAERGGIAGSWDKTVVADCPSDPSLNEQTVSVLAKQRNQHPVDFVLDLSLANDLRARFRVAVLNDDENIVAELLQHDAIMLGLSDAGAHASQLCDANFATHLLGHWVREKGTLSLERAVHLLTARSAELFGIHGRGRLAPGFAADVVVFDAEKVGCSPLRRVNDMPTGADRLVSDAFGIEAVMVNGTLLRQGGNDCIDPSQPLPGRLLRGKNSA